MRFQEIDSSGVEWVAIESLRVTQPPFSVARLMATCPRCKGHLTDSHKCPRRRSVVAAQIAASAVAGGFAGLLLLAIFDPQEQITGLDSILVVAAGSVVCVGINRAMRG
jgi:hypothetical protein